MALKSMKNIRDKVCEISGKKYQQDEKTDVSIKIITDHIRANQWSDQQRKSAVDIYQRFQAVQIAENQK